MTWLEVCHRENLWHCHRYISNHHPANLLIKKTMKFEYKGKHVTNKCAAKHTIIVSWLCHLFQAYCGPTQQRSYDHCVALSSLDIFSLSVSWVANGQHKSSLSAFFSQLTHFHCFSEMFIEFEWLNKGEFFVTMSQH